MREPNLRHQAPPRLRHAIARYAPGSNTIAATGLGGASAGRLVPLSPRCCKPMTPYETAGHPALGDEEPVCGRPEGHNGPCRSEAAVARKYAADAARTAEFRRATGRRYGRPGLARAA